MVGFTEQNIGTEVREINREVEGTASFIVGSLQETLLERSDARKMSTASRMQGGNG
jgi:hypothetical protein